MFGLTNPQASAEGRGVRNVVCPYYDQCLDHACQSNWRGWTCKECGHVNSREETPAVVETFGCRLIIGMIFKPSLFSRYLYTPSRNRLYSHTTDD